MFGSGSITLTQLCLGEVTGDGGRRQGRGSSSSSFAPRAPFFTASAPKGRKQMANVDATELR